MIYTNKVLEIVNEGKGRKAELSSLYGKSLGIELKNVHPKVFFIGTSFNSSLNIEKQKKTGKTIIVQEYEKEKSDDLYLILDLQDYKLFKNDSVLMGVVGAKEFEVIEDYKLSNRSNTCKWDIFILKAPKEKFSILKMHLTSGREEYITICDGFVRCHTSKDSLKRYIQKYR